MSAPSSSPTHESFLDGVLLGGFSAGGSHLRGAQQITSKWYFRWLLKYVPHLAVDSTSPLAMKLICRLVETGTPVVIFPEGRLTITGSLMKVYDGAAFVAAKTGRDGGAGQDRGLRPQFTSGGWPCVSAQSVAQDPHHDSTAAPDPDAEAAVSQASAAGAPRGDDAPYPARHVGCPPGPRRTFFQAFLDAKGNVWLRLTAG